MSNYLDGFGCVGGGAREYALRMWLAWHGQCARRLWRGLGKLPTRDDLITWMHG